MDDEDVFAVEEDPFAVEEDPFAASEEGSDAEPPTLYGSTDEWVRRFLLPSYRRRVTAKGQSGGERWAGAWWGSVEAMTRLEAVWRMWEEVRTSPAELSAWWISHLDAHMKVLLSQAGPFAMSTDENRPGDVLPYTDPPAGMFLPDKLY